MRTLLDGHARRCSATLLNPHDDKAVCGPGDNNGVWSGVILSETSKPPLDIFLYILTHIIHTWLQFTLNMEASILRASLSGNWSVTNPSDMPTD